jgi:predicted AlkP superfamily pyrophosphatase or phosphodiesterase
LVPVFPTKTFPNHYSIVTGLSAEHHGIVSNNMYDPEFDATFSLGDRDAVRDPRWWEGEPIWVTAELQGVTTAAFFWPGTEAPIKGIQPTHWKVYDDDVPNGERVRQVLAWLELPEPTRPRLVTLYFSSVDHAVHRFGLESAEALAAMASVDSALAVLVHGLERRGLRDRVNLVVVSDHGMAATSPDRLIFLDDAVDLAAVRVSDWSPVAALWPAPEQEEQVVRGLRAASTHWRVYRKAEIPERFHYREHRRIAPVIAVADEGWEITTRERFTWSPDSWSGATHGWDPELPSMQALFVAAGPAFAEGLVVPAFQNVHIYELLCAVLRLEPAPNDGSVDSVRVMLRRSPERRRE